MAAARAALRRSDARPEFGWLSEEGHLLVVWRFAGPHGLCGPPEVLTWLPYDGWRRGIRPEKVRGWLIASGQRDVTVAGPGFVLGPTSCHRSNSVADRRPLHIDERGRLVTAQPQLGLPPPRQGMVSAWCPSLRLGTMRQRSCQLDPGTGRTWWLDERVFWDGRWDDETSILHGVWWHTAAWSVDAGETWHQTWDTWNPAVERWQGETYLFSSDAGWERTVYLLPPGVDVRTHFHGVGPPNVVPTGISLPGPRDGYKSWSVTEDGVLVGITRRRAVYVSRGSDWTRIVRRTTAVTPDEVVGDFLVAATPSRSSVLTRPRLLQISADLGRSWSWIDLSDVRPG